MIALRRAGHETAEGDHQVVVSRRWWERPRVATTLQLLVVVITSLVSLELRRRVPVQLNASGYDGLLFERLARSIEGGHWLGRFTQLTLAKGPGYPIFMAAAHAGGIELKVAEQCVYLAAVSATALTFLVTTRRRWLATGAFVLLALDPANFGTASAATLRENLFASLGLLAVAATFLTVLGAVRGSRWVWLALGAVTAGGATGAYWLTREEGVTILPTLGMVCAGVFLVAWWGRRRDGAPRGRRLASAVRPVVALVVLVAAAIAPIAVVRSINDHRYGLAVDNDQAEGSFLRAYADWSRVQAGPEEYRIPITQDQRAAVYPLSSAARVLQGRLENPHNFWRSYGCTHPENGCDYSGGWMIWAMREAAAAAGYFRTAQDEQRYFDRLSAQITAACDSHALTCERRLPASLQPLQRAPWRLLMHNFLAFSRDVVLARGMYDLPSDSAPTSPDWTVTDKQRAEYVAAIHGVPVDADAAAVQRAKFSRHRWQYEVLSLAYHVALPPLLLLALGGVCLAAYRTLRYRERPYLLVLALALGAGILLREFLLALIHTTQYDADQVRYQLPGYFFLSAFAVVGIGAALPAREAVRSAPADAEGPGAPMDEVDTRPVEAPEYDPIGDVEGAHDVSQRPSLR